MNILKQHLLLLLDKKTQSLGSFGSILDEQ